MKKIKIHYPDGTISNEIFYKAHVVGEYFFDVDDMDNIICWRVVKVEDDNEYVKIHSDSANIIKRRFSFLDGNSQ